MTDHTEGSPEERITKGDHVPFLNPDPIAYLVGHSNEAPVLIDGQETIALIDSGAQVSSVSSQFCKVMTLEIQPLGQLLDLEGVGALVCRGQPPDPRDQTL